MSDFICISAPFMCMMNEIFGEAKEMLMDAITLSVEIKEDRQLTIQLPPDVPLGTATLVLLPQNSDATAAINPAREAARAKLLAAGFLRTYPNSASEIISDDQLPIIVPNGSPSLDKIIDVDRGIQ